MQEDGCGYGSDPLRCRDAEAAGAAGGISGQAGRDGEAGRPCPAGQAGLHRQGGRFFGLLITIIGFEISVEGCGWGGGCASLGLTWNAGLGLAKHSGKHETQIVCI